MKNYKLGLIYGAITCAITLLICTVPLEALILPRPPPPYYYTPELYQYTWRASTFLLILIILTFSLLYVHGSRRFYIGILDVQVPTYIVIHYTYLLIMEKLYYSKEGPLVILPFTYVYGGLLHIDPGQILSIYLVYRIVKELKKKFFSRSHN
ncbi:MAG: hypothetical protein GXO10_00875 [Crenarchaeota archaeon]|nr:hypothetical protein [Thermoproteota archaeon]